MRNRYDTGDGENTQIVGEDGVTGGLSMVGGGTW